MEHLVFIIIGLAWVVITRPLYRKNFELFLISLIPINYHFFHLVPRIGAYDNYQESLLVVVLFYFIEVCLLPKIFYQELEDCNINDRYNPIMYLFFIVIFYGSMIALMNGQNVVSTIKEAKLYPLLLMYFVILDKDLEIEKFCRYFVLFALCLTVLVSIQYLFFNKISLFYFYDDATTHLREGSDRGLRIIEGSIIISIATLISFSYLLKKFSWKYLFYAAAMFTELCLVVKTRAEIFGVLLTMLIVSYLYYRDSFSKLIVFTYILLFSVTLSFQAGIFQSYFTKHSIINKTIVDIVGMTSPTSHGNLSIRKKCFIYYVEDIMQSKGLGRGLLSINWQGSTEMYEKNILNFYFSDIGATHLLVFFGIPGGLLLLYSLTCFIRSFFSQSLYDHPAVLSFFVFGITILPFTDIFFASGNFFLFAIFLALLGKMNSHADY